MIGLPVDGVGRPRAELDAPPEISAWPSLTRSRDFRLRLRSPARGNGKLEKPGAIGSDRGDSPSVLTLSRCPLRPTTSWSPRLQLQTLNPCGRRLLCWPKIAV